MSAKDLLIAIAGVLGTGIDDQSIAMVIKLILADRKATVDRCKEEVRGWSQHVSPPPMVRELLDALDLVAIEGQGGGN